MMRSRYGIDGNYDAHDMRIIAGVRYAVNVRYDIATADYVFAQDVSINTITALMEADLPGFEVQVSYIRVQHHLRPSYPGLHRRHERGAVRDL